MKKLLNKVICWFMEHTWEKDAGNNVCSRCEASQEPFWRYIRDIPILTYRDKEKA